MKFLWIGLLLLPLALFAQRERDTTERQPSIAQHELGLNFTFFVKQFIDFGGNTFAISPYAISYKYISPKNHSLRTGMGIGYTNNSQKSNQPGVTNREANSFDVDLRVGYEYRVRLANAWSMFAGFDAIVNVNNATSKTTNEFQSVNLSQKEFAAGAGPVLGVQVHFNKRISLFTESTLYFSSGSTKQENSSFNFNNGTSNKESSTIKASGLSIALPTSLYLAVRLFKK